MDVGTELHYMFHADLAELGHHSAEQQGSWTNRDMFLTPNA